MSAREPLDGIRATPEELAAFAIAADIFEARWAPRRAARRAVLDHAADAFPAIWEAARRARLPQDGPPGPGEGTGPVHGLEPGRGHP